MHFKNRAHINLWIIESLITKLLNGSQTLIRDVVLKQVSQLTKTIWDAGDQLKKLKNYNNLMIQYYGLG